MQTAKYAAPNSLGVFAKNIGWIDFGPKFQLISGNAPVHVVNTLNDGFTVEFDISAITNGVSYPIDAVIPPTITNVPFGTTGYTGINGNVALYATGNGIPNSLTIQINNIIVKNSKNVVVTTYDLIAADAEVTGPLATSPVSYEKMIFTTNGSPWIQIDNLPPTSGIPTTPTVTGINTTTVTETGSGNIPPSTSDPIFSSSSPTALTVNISTAAKEGIAIGIIVTARAQAITDVIESVALEQTALSHILNAEGKKIQKFLIEATTTDEVLSVNQSVQDMVNSINILEMTLKNKLNYFNNCYCNTK